MSKYYLLINGIVVDVFDDYAKACEAWVDSLEYYTNVKLVLMIADSDIIEESQNARL